MKSYLLVPKESIETQAHPGVRGTEQGERVLQRTTALQFMISGRAPDMLRSLGLRSRSSWPPPRAR
jgi:serine protease AprX